jgi:hypothetical protein
VLLVRTGVVSAVIDMIDGPAQLSRQGTGTFARTPPVSCDRGAGFESHGLGQFSKFREFFIFPDPRLKLF